MAVFLDFEAPIADLYEQLDKAKEIESKGKVNVNDTIKDIESKIVEN